MVRIQKMKLAVAAVVSLGCAAPAFADETGVAVIHAQQREKGRTCFVDHYHYGSSSGKATKKLAMAAGVKSWADFTDFEYGSDWAHWGRAAAKSAKCTEDGPKGPWSCDLSARPCR
jgi:hypothetical protein